MGHDQFEKGGLRGIFMVCERGLTAMGNCSENNPDYPPLPWRERAGVREKQAMSTPTFILPHQGGG